MTEPRGDDDRKRKVIAATLAASLFCGPNAPACIKSAILADEGAAQYLIIGARIG